MLACTEIEPLVDALGRARHPSIGRLVSFAAGIFHETTAETFFVGVSRLEAGESLLVSTRGVERRKSLPTAGGGGWIGGNPSELAEELRRLIDQAVDRAVGQRRVAILVGGLDSSAVLATLVARRGASLKDLHVVTSDVSGPSSDARYVDEICAAYGIVPVHMVRDRQTDPSSSFVMGGSPVSGGAMARLLMVRARTLGAELAVSGVGGDEIFGGHVELLASLLWTHPLRALRTIARTRYPEEIDCGAALKLLIKPALRARVPWRWRRRRALRGIYERIPWASPLFLQRAAGSLQANAAVVAPHITTPREYFEHLVASPAYVDLSDAEGQLERASGVPRVDPLLDTDLVRFATSIRPDLLQTGGIHRGLLRLAMKGAMPDRVRMRSGKSDPADDLWTDVEHPSTTPLHSMRELAALGLVDPDAFAVALRMGRRNRLCAFNQFLAAEAFLRRCRLQAV